MDENYNQIEVDSDAMGNALNFLEEGMTCELVFYDDKVISVDLPTSIVREVQYTEPAVKGDTSGKVMKSAKLNQRGLKFLFLRLWKSEIKLKWILEQMNIKVEQNNKQ